jgi:hypothetical protein
VHFNVMCTNTTRLKRNPSLLIPARFDSLWRELEQRLEQKGESWEWSEVVRGLDNLQEVEARFQGKHFVMRSQVLGQAHKAFVAAGVALPPTLREKA